jgi:hypothetical protein
VQGKALNFDFSSLLPLVHLNFFKLDSLPSNAVQTLSQQVLSINDTLSLLGYRTIEEFNQEHSLQIKEYMQQNIMLRDSIWPATKVIGSKEFQKKFN